MQQVALLTLENVLSLLIFMGIGYLLRRSGKLPIQTSATLSSLITTIFLPAYILRSLNQSFTIEKIGSNMKLFGLGCLLVLLVIGLSILLAKLLAKSDFEDRSLRYSFAFANIGYFGYPLIESVFGTEMMGNMIIYCIPLNIAISTYGYLLFSRDERITVKRVLTIPTVIGIMIGCVLGLSGIQLPGVIEGVLSGAGNCMSPASMLLTGFVLGNFPLKKLFSGAKGYLISAIRLVGIPLVFGIGMVLCGVTGVYLMIPLLSFALPLGLNAVVFPESFGIDASDNARTCFISYVLAIVVLPLTFSVICYLAGF